MNEIIVQVLRIVAEVGIFAFGLYIVWKNKDKSKLVSDQAEKIRKQRIKIVLHEGRIEDLEDDNADLEDENRGLGESVAYHKDRQDRKLPAREQTDSRRRRKADRQIELLKLLGPSADEGDIDELVNSEQDDHRKVSKLLRRFSK